MLSAARFMGEGDILRKKQKSITVYGQSGIAIGVQEPVAQKLGLRDGQRLTSARQQAIAGIAVARQGLKEIAEYKQKVN